jgi:hypothetical protein
MFNPIIALIYNTKLSRWHPILFSESPLPGPDRPDKPVRHKSTGHHTVGFATRPEAVAEANGMALKLKSECVGTPRLCLSDDMEWDGEGIPSSVAFFNEDGTKRLL